METYQIFVDVSDRVSGNRSHGTIYPQFSRHFQRRDLFTTLSPGENCSPVITDKITIEDGRFERVSNRIGYTGQHTDIDSHTINQNTITVRGDDPYIYGHIYSRNKYGGRTANWRLDVETRQLQRPITRNGKTTWHDFNPSEFID